MINRFFDWISELFHKELVVPYDDLSWGTVEWAGGNTIQIKPETWAPGLWAGTEGADLEFVAPDGITVTTATVFRVYMDSRQVLLIDSIPNIRGWKVYYAKKQMGPKWL